MIKRMLHAVALGLLFIPGARADILAYTSPSTTGPNQGYGGGFGMDFTVNQSITVTQLGLFNGAFAADNAAGFSGDDFVTLFDSSGTKLAQLEFGNGTGNGTNVAGTSDFVKQLATPLQLSAGFTGSIIAFYTNGTDQLHNSSGNVADTPAETGSPYLTYTGVGRFGGGTQDAYPTSPDSGPANRYHGPTFGFSVVPEPGSAWLLIIGAAGLLLLARRGRQS